MHIIFEVLWFESRLKLGGYSETETRRIGLFRYLDDARAAGEEALDTRYNEIASKTYSADCESVEDVKKAFIAFFKHDGSHINMFNWEEVDDE